MRRPSERVRASTISCVFFKLPSCLNPTHRPYAHCSNVDERSQNGSGSSLSIRFYRGGADGCPARHQLGSADRSRPGRAKGVGGGSAGRECAKILYWCLVLRSPVPRCVFRVASFTCRTTGFHKRCWTVHSRELSRLPTSQMFGRVF